MKELLSIKEFSKFSGVGCSTLRHWDKIGVFSPAVRDAENNYRYYTPQQIIAVNFISVLSKLYIPFKTISSFESNRDPVKIVELIEQQENQLDMEMRKLREAYSIIHTRRDLIRQGLKADTSLISVQELKERTIIIGKPNNFEPDEEFYVPFRRFCDDAAELRINLHYPIGGFYENMPALLRSPGKPDYFFSLDPTGNTVQKAGKYLVGYKRGYYGEFGDLPERMDAFAKANNLTCVGPVYTIHLHDETCIKDPSQYLAQTFVAISGR